MDVICEKSTQNRYSIGAREFDIAELKLLIDAVESSKFITDKESTELAEKLQRQASIHSRDALKRNIRASSRFKPDHEDVLYIADTINRAINSCRKIALYYFSYDANKQKQLRNNGEQYIFSPYYLVWDGDCYYTVGFAEKHGSVGNFRVDRIFGTPEILPDCAVPVPDNFEFDEYIKTTFRMYGSERQSVELICDNSTMDAIIDRFGFDVPTFAEDDSSFRTVVDVTVSHVFYSWVFGFDGKVKIKSPESVRDEYRSMVNRAFERNIT